MKKLNADNGAFGDTPPQNPALETPPYNTKKTGEFSVIAGKYEGPGCEINIKFSRDKLTLNEAIALHMEYQNYPFCYIQYKGLSLIALQGITEQAA